MASPATIASVIPRPGLLARGPEKRYHAGVLAYLGGDRAGALAAFEQVLADDPSILSAHLFAGVAASAVEGATPREVKHLEAVLESSVSLPDRYLTKYLPASRLAIGIGVHVTDTVTVEVGFDSVGATFALAEAYQDAGRLEEAIGLIQQLHEVDPGSSVTTLSLADLLYADNDLNGVVEITNGVDNVDDITVETLHLRASALYAAGHVDAAFEAFKLALAKTAKRDAELLKVVRYDRALAHETSGQRAKAAADWQRLYAIDATFRDVAERARR